MEGNRSIELSMNAVALFTLSCTIMTATAPTMKGAAIPVSIRQVEAAYPHLNPPGHWLGLHESDFSGHVGRLYPILTAAGHFVEPVMMSLKGSRPLFNTKTWIRRRRAADRDTARKIDCFIDPRIYIFYDNFYLNTIKPYIHPNRLSILFPARLCWVFFDIVEANYGVLLQNPGFVRA